jgi:small GTP-binding protein
VGKTSVAIRQCFNQFDESQKETFSVGCYKKIQGFKIKEKKRFVTHRCQLNIWDTMGQERYKSLNSAYYRGAKGAIIVVKVTEEPRLMTDQIRYWHDELHRYIDEEVPVIILINQVDLVQTREDFRDIIMSISKVARRKKCHLTWGSCKTGEGLDQCFEHLVRLIHEKDLLVPMNQNSISAKQFKALGLFDDDNSKDMARRSLAF